MKHPPAPSADPCPRCGIPGFKGCDHFAPFERPVVERPTVNARDANARGKPASKWH